MTFPRKPPTEKDLAEARKAKPRIIEKFRHGMDVRKIATQTGMRVGAIEAVLQESGELHGTPPKSGNSGHGTEANPGPAPSSAQGEVTGATTAPQGSAQTATPPSTLTSPPAPAGNPQQQEQRGGSEASAQPPPGGWPTGARNPNSGQGTAAFTGAVETPQGASPLDGQFIMPDLYAGLLNILKEFGVKEDMAKGIVRQFRYEEPEDYAKLDQIIRTAGFSKQVRESVVNAWKKETEPTPVARGAGSPTDRLSSIRRELGLESSDGTQTPVDKMGLADVEEELAQLKLAEARDEARRRREALEAKASGLVPTGAAGTVGPGAVGSPCPPGWLDQDMIIGGMPKTLRIRQEQLKFYERWIPGSDGKLDSERQSVPVGPPADDPEKAELKRQVEEAKEREREREREERDAARHKEFLDAISALRPQGPSADALALAKEREDRQREREDRRDRELEEERKHRREMEEKLVNMNNPAWVAAQRESLMKGAEAVGMVRPETVGKIKEDDIHLTALRDAETLKSTTASEAMKTGIGLVKRVVDGDTAGGKLKSTVVDKIGPLIDHEIQKHIASDPVNVGSVDVPLPEGALERAAAAAQHELGTDGSVIPLATPPGSGAPPISASDVAKARPETGR